MSAFRLIIRFLQIALLALSLTLVVLPASSQCDTQSGAGPGPLFYDDYTAVLRMFVNDRGYVYYKKLQSDSKSLELFLYRIENLEPIEFEFWTSSDKLAFWLNTYNAIVLKTIIDNYPVESPKNIRGFWSKKIFLVMHKRRSLDEIEQEILREWIDDPRIHIALCKGTIGGAQLRHEPYKGPELDEQLSDQSRHFMLDPKHFQIDLMNSVIYISPIFKEYAKDFLPNYGIDKRFVGLKAPERAVMNFVLTFSAKDVATYMYSKRFEVGYLPYNWNLNEAQ